MVGYAVGAVENTFLERNTRGMLTTHLHTTQNTHITAYVKFQLRPPSDEYTVEVSMAVGAVVHASLENKYAVEPNYNVNLISD
jgi:hypothetical protein